MTRSSNDRLGGTLDLLILKTLASRGVIHGYGITLHVQAVSEEALRVEEGSLYPALHRMTNSGLISAEWGISENSRRARFYKITALGRRHLAAEQRSWAELTAAVDKVLRFA